MEGSREFFLSHAALGSSYEADLHPPIYLSDDEGGHRKAILRVREGVYSRAAKAAQLAAIG